MNAYISLTTKTPESLDQESAASLYKKFWKHDLLAAISVSLVALPLALGIAIASNAPPISGLIAAIVGGIATTFFRTSQVAINGPTAGLIVVILTGNELLADENGSGFPYVLAAICIAGLLQVLIGVLRLGRISEIVPNSVVEGMLAAIGVMILAKQVHVGLGQTSSAESTMGTLLDIPKSLLSLDPKITIITVLSLFILIIYPKVKNKLFHFVPAPVWVLIFAIPYVFLYQHIVADVLNITDINIQFPETQLIDLPEDLLNDLDRPNFSKINSFPFWLVTISIMIIASIETLISSKALDSLDPLKRKTNLDRDLIAIGLSTVISGFLGGLPVITVIVRSSVNISNNAKTKLSNLFHGIILLIFLLVLKPVVEEVPLAALAAILIYTGIKLASTKQFAEAYEKGEEQLLVMASTVIAVLIYGLLWGIVCGIIMAFMVQWIKSRMTMKSFVTAIFVPRLTGIQHENDYELKLGGVFNFLNLMKVKAAVKKIPAREKAVINFEDAILVDYSVMEYIGNYGKNYELKGGTWKVKGLGNHDSTSSHPFSMRMLDPKHQHSPRWMTEHQRNMMRVSAKYGWQFVIGKEFDTDDVRSFPLFKDHPVEYIHNVISGLLPEHNLFINIQDIVFDEGTRLGKIAYDTTVMIIELNDNIPEFMMEKEELFDKLLERAGFRDLAFEDDVAFSNERLIQAPDRAAAKAFFTPQLRAFLLDQKPFHMESDGRRLLIYDRTELLNTNELEEMILFSKAFLIAMK